MSHVPDYLLSYTPTTRHFYVFIWLLVTLSTCVAKFLRFKLVYFALILLVKGLLRKDMKLKAIDTSS